MRVIRGTTLKATTALGAVLLSALAAGQDNPARGGTGGAGGDAGAWAADHRLLEAQSLLADRRPAEIARRADRELSRLLENVTSPEDLPDLDLLKRLCVLKEFGDAVTRLGRLEGRERETAAWLLARPALLETLMTAASPGDSPDAMLRIVSRIRADHGEKPDEWAELTTALAVVYDADPDMSGEGARGPDPERVSRLFAYYVNARDRMRFDLRTLPWALQVFVVECMVSEDELAWALGRYSRRGSISDIYLDVRYEENPTYTPAPGAARSQPGLAGGRYGRLRGDAGIGAMAGIDATLEQLARGGGQTRAQAYFAVSVWRALGIPSAIYVGQGSDGDVRAWGAVLEVVNGRPRFDTEVGRWEEFKQISGQTYDPQPHELMGEDDLTVLTELAATKPADRVRAYALARLAESGDRGRSEIPTAARVALLTESVRLSPGNRAAWAGLRAMGRASDLSVQQTDRVLERVTRELAPRYPELAVDVTRDVVSWRGTREQIESLDKLRPALSGRPDLQVKLVLARADLLLEAKRDREALAAYGWVLDRAADFGPQAVEAMRKVDALLREKREGPALLSTYRRVWTRIPVPGSSGAIRFTAWHQIGTGYAAILEESGDRTAAENLRQRLRQAEDNGTGGVRRGR